MYLCPEWGGIPCFVTDQKYAWLSLGLNYKNLVALYV